MGILQLLMVTAECPIDSPRPATYGMDHWQIRSLANIYSCVYMLKAVSAWCVFCSLWSATARATVVSIVIFQRKLCRQATVTSHRMFAVQ